MWGLGPWSGGSGGHPSLQDRLLAEDGDGSEITCWKNLASVGRRGGRREADTWALQGSRLQGSPAGLSPSSVPAGGGSSDPLGGPQPPAHRALSHPSPQPPAWPEPEMRSRNPSFVNHFPLKPRFGLESRLRPGERGGAWTLTRAARGRRLAASLL